MFGAHAKIKIVAAAAALGLLAVTMPAAAAPSAESGACRDAWSAYNDFKYRTAMDPSQYPLTIQGAAVRSACGESALPAPPGADKPPRHILRRHRASKPAAPGAGSGTATNPVQPLKPVPAIPRTTPEHRRAT